MLDRLVVSAPRLVRPYTEPILKVLLLKLKEADSNPAVIVNILTCVGDLAEVHVYFMQNKVDHLDVLFNKSMVIEPRTYTVTDDT